MVFGYLRTVVDDWRATGSPLDLAIIRVVLFVTIAHFTAVGYDWVWFAEQPDVLRDYPPYTAWLSPFATAPDLARSLRVTVIVSALAAAAGVFTRLAALVTVSAACVLWGLPQIVGGKVDHYHHLLWFAAVLAVSPCGDALSIDAWMKGQPRPAPARAYARPLRIIWSVMGLVYLFPGLAKAAVGPLWVAPENMRRHLYHKWVELPAFEPLMAVDQWPTVLMLGGLNTIAFELSALLLFLHPRTRLLGAAWGLAFHNLTHAFMGIAFWQLQVCYVAMVPWAAALRASPGLADSKRSAGPVTVVGCILVVGVAAAGVTAFDSWPIAVYPRFNYLASATTTRLELDLTAQGVRLPTTDAERAVIQRMKETRWFRILERTASDEHRRNDRARAILAALVTADPRMAAATELRLRRVVRSVIPGDFHAPTLENVEVERIRLHP